MKKEVTFKNIIFFLFHNIQSATQNTPELSDWNFETRIIWIQKTEFLQKPLIKMAQSQK